MPEKRWKVIKRVLWIVSVLASLKIILFDYTMDEEYQIVMAYRNLHGDSLFKEMWEPHQTSAFMCIGLMWFYRFITGTYTGVIVFLRVCTTLIQALLAVWGYRVFRRFTEDKYAFLLSIAYFHFVPKNIQIPEFSNMQVWFFGVMVFALMEYYLPMGQEGDRKRHSWWLVLSGVGMALEILAYPSCLILFPFCMIYIWFASGQRRIRDCLIYIATCGTCGSLWLAFILRKLPMNEFVRNVRNIFGFDLTHEISGATEGKLSGIANNVVSGGIFLIVIAIVSGCVFIAVQRRERRAETQTEPMVKRLQLLTIAVCVAEVIQLFFWVVLQKGFEFPHIHVVVIFLAVLFVWRECGDNRRILALGVFGTLLSYVAVVYISDLQIYNALPHGALGVILCVLVLVLVWDKQNYVNARKWIFILLFGVCVTTLVGKGYTFRGGRDYASIWDTRGVMKHGPAAGIFTDYMFAYIYNCNYEDFTQYTEENDKLLIVTNLVHSAGTTPYLFRDSEVCHYSIVDPTAYDERLVEYWKLYPEKMPDVIVVDCWYGGLLEPADSYIMHYIEEEFGYTEAIDGRYVRFYKR